MFACQNCGANSDTEMHFPGCPHLWPEPRPCTHDDPSWCTAECERWRQWIKALRSSTPQPDK